MPTVREIESALYELAPRELAMEWDNVGLLVGSPDREVGRVLVALDVTESAAAEATDLGAEVIVAHHPVMNCAWAPVQTLRDDTPQGRLLTTLVRRNLSAICMHTNLDRAQGGVNDVLAAVLGLEDVERLSGGDDIVRQGRLPAAMALPDFLERVGKALGPNGIRYTDGERPIRRVAVGGGACGSFFRAAAAGGCDALVTADVKYDQFLDARALGLTLIDAGHFPTENVICPVLVRFLEERFCGLEVVRSAVHREVVRYFAVP